MPRRAPRYLCGAAVRVGKDYTPLHRDPRLAA